VEIKSQVILFKCCNQPFERIMVPRISGGKVLEFVWKVDNRQEYEDHHELCLRNIAKEICEANHGVG
jgi:hypothetical protein